MTPHISRKDFDRSLDGYAHCMVHTFHHQPSGIEAARRDLGLFSGYLEDIGASHITGDILLGFLSHLSIERNNQAGSINRKISSVRMYVRYLRFKQVDGASDLPIESLQRARQPYAGPMQALSLSEVHRILDAADRTTVLGFRDHVLFTLSYRLGLRIGEALALDVTDLDFDKEVLHIQGKGRRARILPLLPDLADLLRDWLLLRRRLFRADQLTALFVSKKGHRLAARTAQEAFQALVQKAGPLSLVKVTPHSLRHAFATHAMEGNADLITLKAVLGHACMKSTEIYLHPSIRVLRRAVADHPASEILSEIASFPTDVIPIQGATRRVA